jgi:carbohydrate binding protein with CBM6 domain
MDKARAALFFAATISLIGAGSMFATTAGQRYVPIAPCRLLDTRSSGPAFSSSFTQRDVAVWNAAPCGIPSNAKVVAANFTAVVSPGGPSGLFQLYASGTTASNASALNFDSSNSAIGNQAWVALGTNGAFHVAYNGAGAGTVDLIVDVSGYFSDAPGAASYAFQSLTSCRLYDSRTLNDPLVAGPPRRMTVAGSCGIPTGAAAAAISVTIPSASSEGFVQMFPSDLSSTATAAVNFKVTDLARTNGATAGFALGRSDQIALTVGAAANANFILDTNGYFSSNAPAVYYPISPCRIADTRNAGGGIPRLVSGRDQDFQIQGLCGVPIGASAAALNITSIGNDGAGHLIGWPSGQTAPSASFMALSATRITFANQSVQRLSSNVRDLTIHPYIPGGGTDLTVDVVGYFAPPAAPVRTPFLGAAVQIPGRIQAENYDLGGEGFTWHDTTPGNAFGVYRSDDMDVGAIPAGGYHIGALADGEWAEYSVDIPSGGTYDMTVRYASAYTGTTKFRVFVNGINLVPAQTLTSTGDWQTYVTKTVSVTLNAGSGQVVHVAFDTGAWNFDWLDFVQPVCTAPTFTSQTTLSVDPNSVTPDSTLTFAATASGSPAPTYQWLYNGAVPTATNVSGATTNQLVVDKPEEFRNAGAYSLRAQNSCGTAVSNPITIGVSCGGSPIHLEVDLGRALRGDQGNHCNWSPEVINTFPDSTPNGQTYNRPVLAAAIAYLRQPMNGNTWDMTTWWPKYLRGELGDRGPAAWQWGGEELGSYNYQRYNEAAVLGMHYAAGKKGDTTTRDLARRWLRATFALHALAGVPGPLATVHSQGTSLPAPSYDGPYVAMAGERSLWGYWGEYDRGILLAQALGHTFNTQGEAAEQQGIRKVVEDTWMPIYDPGFTPYGLTGSDQSDLWNIVVSGTVQSDFIDRYLGAGLRTEVPYHFISWPGVRVTLMEESRHTSTAPTYGVAYFAAGNEAHFLFPWEGVFSDPKERNVSTGTAYYDPANHLMSATAVRPPMTETITNLPATPPSFWLTLRPDQPPAFH